MLDENGKVQYDAKRDEMHEWLLQNIPGLTVQALSTMTNCCVWSYTKKRFVYKGTDGPAIHAEYLLLRKIYTKATGINENPTWGPSLLEGDRYTPKYLCPPTPQQWRIRVSPSRRR